MKRGTFKKKIGKPMKRSRLRTISPNKVKKPKAHNASWWQKKCDTMMQDINRANYPKCMVCGKKNEVGHHFITKACSSWLRYKFENLIPLCHNCHFAHHIRSDPYIAGSIRHQKGEEWYAWIEEHRRLPQQTGVKYYQEVYKTLEALQQGNNLVK
jgi:5-methylcytosine-specific restriction endonuclease McrA